MASKLARACAMWRSRSTYHNPRTTIHVPRLTYHDSRTTIHDPPHRPAWPSRRRG